VSSLADGSVGGGNWALTVVLRDGRGITSQATRGRPGNPEIITAIRQAADRYEVPAALTGVPTQRRRAWLDAAAEARWLARRLAAWLVIALIAAAAVGPLIRLGVTHEGDPSKVAGFFAWLAIFMGLLAVFLVVAAWRGWLQRQRLLGRRPVQDSYGAGSWFAVPLPGDAGFLPGLITTTEPREDGLLLCYFFPPSDTEEPELDQVRALRPADAIAVRKLVKLGRKWPRVGQDPGWDRGEWPVPAFRLDSKNSEPLIAIYDDDLRFIRLEPADHEQLDAMPGNDPLTSSSVETELASLLGMRARTEAESVPAESVPAESVPVEPVRAESVPVESVPVGTDSVLADAGDAQPPAAR
jgi:hypothetical protein